jgi:hypothetical protein
MTIKDFMVECELFKHSQENYKFMKEASELTLMEGYIDSQKFLAENATLVTESASYLTEGFLFESQGNDAIALLESKYTDKAKKFMGDAKAWILKIWNGFISFLKNLGKKMKDVSAKAEDVVRKLTALNEVTDADKEAIKKVVEAAIETSGAPISEKQVEGFHKLPSNILKWNDNAIKDKLAAALVNRKIQTTIASDGPYNMAIAERHINKFFDKVAKNLTEDNEKGVETLQKVLERYINESRTRGIVVSADSGTIDELIKQLEAYRFKIENLNLDKDYKGKMSELGQKFFEDTSSTMAHCIALYTAVNNYRMQVIVGLAGILKK